jgi:hypothetical protein
MTLPPDQTIFIHPENISALKPQIDKCFQNNIFQKTIKNWRQELRQELAIKNPELNPKQKWYCTGHQPWPIHPGIWIKRWLINKLANNTHSQAINIYLDLEKTGQVRFPNPSEPNSISTINFPDYWFDEIDINLLIKELQNCTLPSDLFSKIKQIVTSRIKAWESIKLLIETWESDLTLSIINITQSDIFNTKTIQSFFLNILSNPEKLFSEYNNALNKYRKKHKIKNSANPFPNLKKENDLLEMPFWIYKNNKRNSLRINQKTKEWHYDKTILAKPYPNIIPKAIFLTSTIRLLLADIFVHGIGGKKYEDFSDFFFSNFFNIEVPPYITASASFGLDNGNVKKLENKIKNFKEIEHLYKYNPEKILDKINIKQKVDLNNEIAQKQRLLLSFNNPISNKKETAQKLAIVNDDIRKKLALVWEKLKIQQQVIEKEYLDIKYLANREIPILFHSKVPGLFYTIAPAPFSKGV